MDTKLILDIHSCKLLWCIICTLHVYNYTHLWTFFSELSRHENDCITVWLKLTCKLSNFTTKLIQCMQKLLHYTIQLCICTSNAIVTLDLLHQHSLKYLRSKYNGNCIIKNTLSEHQHVQNRIHIQGMENSQSCHWIYSRNQGPKGKRLDPTQLVHHLGL